MTKSNQTIPVLRMGMPMPELQLANPAKRRSFDHINTLMGSDLERYASDYSAEELRQARELWKKYAARKELLDGGDGQRRYTFREREMIYFMILKSGKRYPVSAASMRTDIDRFAGGMDQELRALAAQLAAGQITSQQWYDESRRLMKLSYRTSVDVARGKTTEMTPEEKQHYLEAILLLLLLLNNFSRSVELGLALDGKFVTRARMYGQNIRALYENWRLWAAILGGNTEGRRVLHPADHCTTHKDRPGCIELAAQGWIPIRNIIQIGNAACFSNCKCTLEFRGAKESPL
jgi:hypothetical protein